MRRFFCVAAVTAAIWPVLSTCRGQSAPAGGPSGEAGATTEQEDPTAAPVPAAPPKRAGTIAKDAASVQAAQRRAAERLEKLGAQLDENDDGDVLGVRAEGLKLTAADLNRLADLPALASLEIIDTPLTEDALACVGRLVGLRRLYLKNVSLTDARLSALRGLADLEGLSLPSNRITGKGLGLLSGLGKIEVLNLAHNPLGDEALPHVGKLPALNTLVLADTQVTGAGLVHLKPLSMLIVLNLDRCKIAGDHLLHLKGHDRLRMLYLRGCNVSEEKVNELDEAISGLSIYTSSDD